MNPRPLLPLVLLLATACGGDPGDPGGTQGEGARAAERARAPRDPRLAPVAMALEDGRLAEAEELLAALRDAPDGPDPVALVELSARARFLSGDPVAAFREIEDARRSHDDARLWATEAELYAALGRAGAADEAYQQGLKIGGRTPELERTHGVLRIIQPGGAERGLEALQRALREDPELPFVRFPLSQAHLLVGRERLADEPGTARAHALSGLELAPDQPDLRELLAEAYEALGDFDAAIEVVAGLEADGRFHGDRRALLHQRAATAALLGKDREAALEHYRLARELGLDDEGLGFGASALRDAAAEAVDRGYVLLESGDPEGAEDAFARALAFAPESPEARHFLGAARFRRERFVEAALVWEELLRSSVEEGLELPDPVHLNLARAWRLADETERARAVLEDYLARAPDGPWAAETREMLDKLGG